MNPGYPPGPGEGPWGQPQQPPPVGFEMQNVGGGNPGALGFDGVNQVAPVPYGPAPPGQGAPGPYGVPPPDQLYQNGGHGPGPGYMPGPTPVESHVPIGFESTGYGLAGGGSIPPQGMPVPATGYNSMGTTNYYSPGLYPNLLPGPGFIPSNGIHPSPHDISGEGMDIGSGMEHFGFSGNQRSPTGTDTDESYKKHASIAGRVKSGGGGGPLYPEVPAPSPTTYEPPKTSEDVALLDENKAVQEMNGQDMDEEGLKDSNKGNGAIPVSAGVIVMAKIKAQGLLARFRAPQVLYLSKELEMKRETMFFRDGHRRIDFVLSYQDSDKPEKTQKRDVFEKNLIEEGLELEYEDKKDSQDGKTHFVKIHAPWEVLTRVAELIGLKMPIKEYDVAVSDMERCCASMPNPFELPTEVLPEEADYFTADFNREREKMFIIKDKETFFSVSQRSLIVNELLLRTRYEEERDKFGVDRLVRQGVYTAAFPLHEGKYTSEHSILTHGGDNDRHLLYETWARPGRWYFFQPLDLIRRYFGEKVAIYFTWLGFYTAMLIPASIVGVIVFIYGCATLGGNSPSNEICDVSGPGNFTMCPLCDRRCPYWQLVSSCRYSRLTYLFDNAGTVFFAGFMAIWSTMFLEFWKRKQAEIQYDWDVAGYELEEHMRPDFEAKCKTKKMNPITQLMEPFQPLYSKIPRRCTSLVVVLFMICCVVAAVFGVIMYRIIIVALLYKSDNSLIRENAKITTTVTAACINLVLIMLLNRVYLTVALWLTEMERPRTDSEYEDSFTFKMFLFQFINFYSSIFYIAFFKGRTKGRPGDYDYSLGYRQEECDPAGCLIELCIQLGIVMVGKQIFNNFKEIMLPKILNWFRSRSAKKHETEDNLYTRWEQDKDLQELPNLGLFDEYLEMVIQYGFVTIFVAAFPLAPLCALINNVVEIRLDAYKFVTQWRRPVALRAQDIGIWFGILKTISFLAVLTNAFIIGWTSDFVPKLVYFYTKGNGSLAGYINYSLSTFDVSDFQARSRPDNNSTVYGVVDFCRYSDYRYPPDSPLKYTYTADYWHIFCARLAFVIVFEHVVFLATMMVGYLIPDVPARVRQLMLRELYLAKEARYQTSFANVHEEKQARKDEEERTRQRSIDVADQDV